MHFQTLEDSVCYCCYAEPQLACVSRSALGFCFFNFHQVASVTWDSWRRDRGEALQVAFTPDLVTENAKADH